jgi:hypothetical protein
MLGMSALAAVDFTGLITTVVSVLGLYLAVNARIKQNIAHAQMAEARIKNIEDDAVQKTKLLETLQAHVSTMERRLTILNHNSTAIYSALVAKEIIPAEVLRALEEVD